jgi:hypothetical protein
VAAAAAAAPPPPPPIALVNGKLCQQHQCYRLERHRIGQIPRPGQGLALGCTRAHEIQKPSHSCALAARPVYNPETPGWEARGFEPDPAHVRLPHVTERLRVVEVAERLR